MRYINICYVMLCYVMIPTLLVIRSIIVSFLRILPLLRPLLSSAVVNIDYDPVIYFSSSSSNVCKLVCLYTCIFCIYDTT